MIKCKFKFGDSNAVDSYDTYRFVYMSSDDTFNAPIKDEETTKYANEEGEHTTAKYYEDAFDFKIRFAIVTSGINTNDWANKQIKGFIAATHDNDKKKQVTFTCPYKGLKIVGIVTKVDTKDFFRRNNQDECVQVEVTIRVSKPSLCDFNYTE